MTKKHARLASAVADAMLAQGFTQKQVATAAGITQSALSSAISGRYDIKEENWKMICENLGLCYEDVIAEPEPEAAPPAIEEIGGGTAVPVIAKEAGKMDALVFNEEERRLLDVVARYMAGHLKEDIRKGVDISLDDLYTLLDVCKRMQCAAEAGQEED